MAIASTYTCVNTCNKRIIRHTLWLASGSSAVGFTRGVPRVIMGGAAGGEAQRYVPVKPF